MDRPKLIKTLVKHEGLKLQPYIDTVGKVTIGVGRNLTDRGISEATATQMLNEDIDEVEADLATFPWWDNLGDVRQRVVADMRFNLGFSGFRTFKNTIKAIEEARYGDAADNMLASKWAKQVKGRAVRLARWMRTGDDK